MKFQKGNKMASLRKDRTVAKTVWVREELAKQGYDFEKTLVGFLERAARGDKLAYDMAALLVKLLPHLANQPKHDVGIAQVDTLVINRYDAAKVSAPVDTTAIETGEDGQGPTVTSITDPAQ